MDKVKHFRPMRCEAFMYPKTCSLARMSTRHHPAIHVESGQIAAQAPRGTFRDRGFAQFLLRSLWQSKLCSVEDALAMELGRAGALYHICMQTGISAARVLHQCCVVCMSPLQEKQ
ncbi:unnamed protein product [Ostreobium quekettii]|uniref:Uncharacterized protein n=1 Tax=Ostreobium quekettii TaxID=121088 RepID=A0A8S1IR57_9CHLO|nr:unnamed protein product [Ostreobium quekettii]